jgi:F0F1-type ATP synthase assembly protein I
MVQGLFDEEDSENKEASSSNDPVDSIFSSVKKDDTVVTRPAYTPDTVEETARKSGLAFSAGIAFFGSMVFMLLLGWFADLLLGSSPWGIVAGIVLGSIIGFIQFFRITSQIFGKPDTPKRSFLSDENEK